MTSSRRSSGKTSGWSTSPTAIRRTSRGRRPSPRVPSGNVSLRLDATAPTELSVAVHAVDRPENYVLDEWDL